MKNILVALFAFVAISAMSFATVVDNTGTAADGKHSGTGTFRCTVITPLSVVVTPAEQTSGDGYNVDLGVFVVSGTHYDLENKVITFTIGGEKDYSFFYKIEQNTVGTIGGKATLTLDWKLGTAAATVGGATATTATLNGSGAAVITVEATEVLANASGADTYPQTVTVAYNTF